MDGWIREREREGEREREHATLRSKSKDWLGRNQSGTTCLPTDCCFSDRSKTLIRREEH